MSMRLQRIAASIIGLAASSMSTFVAGEAAASPTLKFDENWSLTASGQLRPRAIVHTGRDFLPDSELEEVVTQRAALGLRLSQEGGPAFVLRIQDVRTWGEENNTLNDYSAEGLDAREAYVSLPVASGLALHVGRQAVSFDTQRLIGAVEWRQSGRSFDGGRLTYAGDFGDVDLFYAKVRESGQHPDGAVPDERFGDVDLGVAHASFSLGEGMSIAPIYVFNHNDAIDDSKDDNSRHTVGVTLQSKPLTGLSLTGEGFYQLGTFRNEDVRAYLAAARVGYVADVPLKPSLTGWLEVVSGDGTPEGAFDTLYATNHKFYGEADFFLNIPANAGNLGLVDIGGRIGFKPLEKLGFHVDVHHFRSMESDSEGDSTFGTELDFKLVYSAREDVQLRGMYALFLAGPTIGSVREIDHPADESFAYVTLDYKF